MKRVWSLGLVLLFVFVNAASAYAATNEMKL